MSLYKLVCFFKTRNTWCVTRHKFTFYTKKKQNLPVIHWNWPSSRRIVKASPGFTCTRITCGETKTTLTFSLVQQQTEAWTTLHSARVNIYHHGCGVNKSSNISDNKSQSKQVWATKSTKEINKEQDWLTGAKVITSLSPVLTVVLTLARRDKQSLNGKKHFSRIFFKVSVNANNHCHTRTTESTNSAHYVCKEVLNVTHTLSSLERWTVSK